MNSKITLIAWNTSLSPLEKLVLLGFAYFADESGVATPGVNQLADKTGISRRHLFRVLKDLESKGLLKRIGQDDKGTARWQVNAH